MNRFHLISLALKRLVSRSALLRVFLCLSLATLLLSTSPTVPVQAASTINIFGPGGSFQFGSQIISLPNGNLIVTDPNFPNATNLGAVYLYDGKTKVLISTLTGSHPDDEIASLEIMVLSDGDFIVISPNWANGSATQAGAVTWCSGTRGCAGVVSATNSLVGSQTGDEVGLNPLTYTPGIELLKNGNYVVTSLNWANNSGAVTWCAGAGGCKGAVSAANSLVCSQAGDQVGSGGITSLRNGNFVVTTKNWANGSVTGAGAITWCSGGGGCVGAVSATNSLVGGQTGVQVGSGGITLLDNGNFVVSSPNWSSGGASQAGAITWCSGTVGCHGAISTNNSLVGSATGDGIGVVTGLSNGNYVVFSPNWANGTAGKAGAVTWCSGTSGCVGAVSVTNSLTGSQTGDAVGSDRLGLRHLALLSNGNYVVGSPLWANESASAAGAVSWCSGISGCRGAVSATNSLVGSEAGDMIGADSDSIINIATLDNGNYVVNSPFWSNGSASGAGAATWCSGTMGCRGAVSATNSLVGSQANDYVGSFTVSLSNNNYVVMSPGWANGSTASAGAVTWCSGATGCRGAVSAANSLVGSHTGDLVGASASGVASYLTNITELKNGNYVVGSPHWANGGSLNSGASTWCSGATGCEGAASAANSLVGGQANDKVGLSIIELSNNNYIVGSPSWANGVAASAGAVTWCSGTSGCDGAVSATNSLVGSQSDDVVGNDVGDYSSLITELNNGSYVVGSPTWANGAAAMAGAVTWCSEATGCRGAVSTANSLVGSQAGDHVGSKGIRTLANGNFVVDSPLWANGTASSAGAVTWCSETVGCQGAVSATNSLVGDHPGDQVGSFFIDSACGHGAPCPLTMDAITILSTGNFVVSTPDWNGNGAPSSSGVASSPGAVTWCSGLKGCHGTITSDNSLTVRGVVTALGDGNFVVRSPIGLDFMGYGWVVGPLTTICSGISASPTGSTTDTNSIQGTRWIYDSVNHQVVASSPDENRVTVFTPLFPILTSSIVSGDWANPATWDGGVPAAGSPVTIRDGTSVTLSGGSAAVASLTIQPGGALTLISGTLTLSGGFTNQGSFNGGDGVLALAGDFDNEGSFEGHKGGLVFDGQGEQTVSGSSPASFYNLTVRPGVTLVDASTASNSVQGTLVNQGAIRKSLAVSGPGALDVGLTGAAVFVAYPGGLTNLLVERVDQNLPNGNLGYVPGSVSTQTGAYWTVTAESGPGQYNANLGLPTRLGAAPAFACRPAGADWDCVKDGSGGGMVWRNGLAQIVGSWTVGWQPRFWHYLPVVGN